MIRKRKRFWEEEAEKDILPIKWKPKKKKIR